WFTGRLVPDLRFLLKVWFPLPLLQRTVHVGGVAPQKTGTLRRLISLLQHGRLDEIASHFTEGSALSRLATACGSSRAGTKRGQADGEA
ncbi:MAG TPA: hypothetical protein VJ124_01455, partial [Pyrinomonadaceae bacterium]|nr:hypothetical protein [Pyrinomonadaceae bacterium]